MINNCINYLRNYFNSNGYHLAPISNPNIYSFIKIAQNHVYIINVFDIELYPRHQWSYIIKKSETELYSYYDKFPVHRKIILNILVGNEEINQVYTSLKDMPINYDSDIMSISWLIDTENKGLLVPEHMPNKVLGIEEEINHYLHPDKRRKHKEHFHLKKKTLMPVITYTFIGVNVLFWVLYSFLYNENYILQIMGLNSIKLFKNFEVWRLFTSMFTHLEFSHLFFNMFSLYIFGSRLEKYMEPTKFTIVYLTSGLIAGLCSSAINYLTKPSINQINTYLIGASGAIFGIIGGALALAHSSGDNLEDLNAFIIFIMAIVGIFMGFTQPNVDNIAHIVGFVSGFAFTKIIINSK